MANKGLTEKHWKALKLLEQSKTRKDIADALGFSVGYLEALCSGDVRKGGAVATLFKAEYQKGLAKAKDETDRLIRQNLNTAQKLIAEVFVEIGDKGKKSQEDKKLLSMYTNAIAKCQPAQNIKNLSFSYTKGLLPEELIHEFKRLKTIAESSFERGAVREAPEGRAGDVPQIDE